jgi:uncharacterized protein (TIGR02265 family)
MERRTVANAFAGDDERDRGSVDLSSLVRRVASSETERAVVSANLSQFPARVKSRGLFVQGLASLVSARLSSAAVAPLYAAAGLSERIVAFKLYPHVDFYKLYYLAAVAMERAVPLPVALRRTARRFFPIFSESAFGKTMSALMGQEPATILPLLAKAYNVSVDNNSHDVRLDGPRRAIWHAHTEAVEWYEETFSGIVEGAMPSGQSIEVRLDQKTMLGDMQRQTFTIRW